MSDQEPWSILSSITQLPCPHCGEDNERGATECEVCGGVLVPEADDDPSFSMVEAPSGGMVARNVRVPFEERKNVVKIKKALEGIREGTMSIPEYKKLVEEVHYVSSGALALFDTPAAIKKVEALSEELHEIFLDIQDRYEDLNTGVLRMLQYLKSMDPNDVEEGSTMAHEAMRELDKLQYEAYETQPAE